MRILVPICKSSIPTLRTTSQEDALPLLGLFDLPTSHVRLGLIALVLGSNGGIDGKLEDFADPSSLFG